MSEDLRKQNGGPAGGIITMPPQNEALTLRDQFAMNTIPMTWRLVEAGCLDPDVNDMARYAYQMADAMLAARNKQS
ncbi:hypothetical protein [Providencia vermicola]|uniref:hypothetical protein n=1 Tax=Providencia vermicola TaxID=333965 RepID=UPI0032D9B4A0